MGGAGLRRLSGDDLAVRVGVTAEDIHFMEGGRLPVPVLACRIEQSLGLVPQSLLVLAWSDDQDRAKGEWRRATGMLAV
jgi:hypothetical protein